MNIKALRKRRFCFFIKIFWRTLDFWCFLLYNEKEIIDGIGFTSRNEIKKIKIYFSGSDY